ncbi:MAG TPA: hypothetical protein VKB47_06690 [Terracidiphilus sp.]|nr:hypothetical protein [Terracidiphilus sp.]
MRRFRLAASGMALAGVLALSACEHTVFWAGVSVPPPPPLGGPIGVAPGSGWVWTDGFYNWGGSSWVWQPGRWARPPHPGNVWRRPTYERYRNGYRMHPGRWVRR